MPYATATDYIARFGADAAAQLLADEQRLLTGQLLRDAVAVAGGGAWTGSPTADEQHAATAALAHLVRQLEVASSTMDSYLRVAVTLPLAADTATAGTLQDCCLALTRNGLSVDAGQATEVVTKTADRWVSWLRDVAARRVQLVSTTGEPAPVSGGVRHGRAASAFNWGAFGGVR